MELSKVKKCISCSHAFKTDDGEYTCENTDLVVVVNGVPSEYHLCCRHGVNLHRENCPTKRKVLEYDLHGHLIEEHESVISAMRKRRINNSYMYKVLKGIIPSYKGMIFRYEGEETNG